MDAGVPGTEWNDARKWTRFYLDFCGKYGHSPRSPSSLGPFLAKLAEKGQGQGRRRSAESVIRLLLAPKVDRDRSTSLVSELDGHSVASETSDASGSVPGVTWDEEYQKLRVTCS